MKPVVNPLPWSRARQPACVSPRPVTRLATALLVGLFGILVPTVAHSALNVSFTFHGHGGVSSDGLGQHGAGNAVQADVPPGSKVKKAFLYGATTSKGDASITVDFDGTLVTLDDIGSEHSFLAAYRADVTEQVSDKVGSGGEITDFVIGSDSATLDGVALVVVFSNPEEPDVSIAVLDGGLSSDANVTTIRYAAPIDKGQEFLATMALGISFSLQSSEGGSHDCGTEAAQGSLVDVNGQRLTSCAGNLDDGVGGAENGNLITVGGVGDDTKNPSDPFQMPADGKMPRVQDDELYDIAPFIRNGDAETIVNTRNPSQDDQIFLLIARITARATFSTEICDDQIDNDGDDLIDAEDPDCGGAPVRPKRGRVVEVDESDESGDPGDIVDAGGVKIHNRSDETQIIRCARVSFSRPRLFDSALLVGHANRSTGRAKARPKRSTRFCFVPLLRVPPRQTANLELFVRFAPSPRAGSSSQRLTDVHVRSSSGLARYGGVPAALGTVTKQ
ncbi:MAG: hypothetical protein QOD06_2224 [Candidatus Binatota bacterium]|nr:hypothetical protein [Candidatus Binatota bacterium]